MGMVSHISVNTVFADMINLHLLILISTGVAMFQQCTKQKMEKHWVDGLTIKGQRRAKVH